MEIPWRVGTEWHGRGLRTMKNKRIGSRLRRSRGRGTMNHMNHLNRKWIVMRAFSRMVWPDRRAGRPPKNAPRTSQPRCRPLTALHPPLPDRAARRSAPTMLAHRNYMGFRLTMPRVFCPCDFDLPRVFRVCRNDDSGEMGGWKMSTICCGALSCGWRAGKQTDWFASTALTRGKP